MSELNGNGRSEDQGSKIRQDAKALADLSAAAAGERMGEMLYKDATREGSKTVVYCLLQIAEELERIADSLENHSLVMPQQKKPNQGGV